jgi:HK97 family phage prohead protease
MNNYEFEVRNQDLEERTLSGIAVPYNETISVSGIEERFERGAIASIEDVKLFYGHKEPIGKVTRGEETDEGFLVEARISDTERGNEVLTLMRDGVLNKMSVGFQAVKDRKEEGVVVREEVALKEVSIVSFPAYKNADVLAVRQDEAPNTNTLENVMETPENTNTEVREEIDALSREIASLREAAPVVSVAPSYNSFGDFVKAVVRGDEEALEMTRAYAGAVVSAEGPDSIGRDAWVNEALLMVDHGRPSLNAFRRAGLPEAGLNIDYPAVSANTIATEEQAAQGDTLTFGKLSLQTKTTPVLTIGGWTDVSRQTIERSSVAYLSEVFRAMSLAYGKETNARFIENLAGGTYDASTATPGTAEGITGAVADASISLYENAGVRPGFILASSDVWKTLVSLFAVDGRPVVGGQAPVNNIGSSNLPGMTANVFGLEVIVDPALDDGSFYIANSNAITTWEAGGAPFRLSDEDITNLTNQFSIYGYIAFGTIYPEMIYQVNMA